MDSANGSPAELSAIGLTCSPSPLTWETHAAYDGDFGQSPSTSRVLPSGGDSSAFETLPVRRDALPHNDFLHCLNREKRRSERSKAPLSLVLYRPEPFDGSNENKAHRLLEALYRIKRETDLLGRLCDGAIAVLCTDTDELGTNGFMNKTKLLSDELHYEVVAATYPSMLFERLADGARKSSVFEPLLILDVPPEGQAGYALKRGLDILGVVVAVCLLAPLLLAVTAIIASTSPGPVIFRQKRLGKGGVPFTFYKFRSMVADGDDRIHREFVANLIKNTDTSAEADQARPALYKLQSDPRITRVGRFMRKTSIDELPQLFNVLKGDMSLVGPRPPIPYETAHYQSWHLRRILTVKPGMTGLWQVQGRSRVKFDDMVRMDIRYIQECSMWLDLTILLKTISVVVRCSGSS